MATISASLIGAYSPQTVQIVLSGLTVGADYEVVGNWSGGSWPVRGGVGTAPTSQVVLSDVASPINVPITYAVTHNGATASSGSVTVTYARRAVLQSLAGDISVAMDLRDNAAPFSLSLRQAAFQIPGRANPVVRYDVAGSESGELVVNTDGVDTVVMKTLIKSGAPLLLRTDGAVCDLDPVMFLAVTDASARLLVGTRRRWTLAYQLVDDPEPTSPTGLPTWEDFDTAYAGLTWADFDAEWSGRTWAQFDIVDWATRAAS